MFTPTLLALSSLSGLALASPFLAPTSPAPELFNSLISSGCSTTGTESCHNTTKVANTCCFEANGFLQQVQFWDTDPVTGPSNSWTIHGLWPNYCTSSYPQNCDTSRAYTDISGLLTAQGASSTLSYMNTYWKNQGDTDEELWEHEWAKHGTCMTTLQTKCLPSGSPKGAEAVAFFQTVVGLFQNLPTYQWLAAAGITPSSSTTHTLASLQSALKAKYGYTPELDCESGALYQVSYYYYLKGSVIDGQYIPTDAPSGSSTCSSSGIKYLPKSGGSPAPTSTAPGTTSTKTSTSGGSSPTASGIPSKAHLTAIAADGSSAGGLLTAGTLSTQTPGTYTLSGSASGFTMSTTKGACAISSSALQCGSGVSASTFTAASDGAGNTLLAYKGSTAFSTDDSPSGSTVETVYTGTSHDVAFSLAIAST